MPDTAMPNYREFARAALLEVTPAATIGDFVGDGAVGEEVTNYRFETTMSGYPGWIWSITVAHLSDQEPTVVESELLPADGALLAPDWVPWSERMDDYRAAQAAAAAAGEAVEVDGDDEDDDEDDDDDDFGSDVLHGGDLDGVDIDEADPDALGADEEEPDDADSEEIESELLNVQVDQGDQAEAEADSGSENPPRVPRRRKRASKEQENHQGD
jgi:hypothetical protein